MQCKSQASMNLTYAVSWARASSGSQNKSGTMKDTNLEAIQHPYKKAMISIHCCWENIKEMYIHSTSMVILAWFCFTATFMLVQSIFVTDENYEAKMAVIVIKVEK